MKGRGRQVTVIFIAEVSDYPNSPKIRRREGKAVSERFSQAHLIGGYPSGYGAVLIKQLR